MKNFFINIMKFGRNLTIISKKVIANVCIIKRIKKWKKIYKKGGFQCICTQVILINSIYWIYGNYYPRVFLDKHKFNDDIEIYSDDSNEKRFWSALITKCQKCGENLLKKYRKFLFFRLCKFPCQIHKIYF